MWDLKLHIPYTMIHDWSRDLWAMITWPDRPGDLWPLIHEINDRHVAISRTMTCVQTNWPVIDHNGLWPVTDSMTFDLWSQQLTCGWLCDVSCLQRSLLHLSRHASKRGALLPKLLQQFEGERSSSALIAGTQEHTHGIMWHWSEITYLDICTILCLF